MLVVFETASDVSIRNEYVRKVLKLHDHPATTVEKRILWTTFKYMMPFVYQVFFAQKMATNLYKTFPKMFDGN